jgi:uncharacterized SAM-binding protein YcdF (DUF218 family)
MTTDEAARIILEYMKLGMKLRKCDVIIGLGSSDRRVAERAAEVMLNGYGNWLVFSGGLGKITKARQTQPEARVFRDIALTMGVPAGKILIEERSTNTGQNLSFTAQLLAEHQLHPWSVLVVTKPYMERRLFAAFKRQWPDPSVELVVTSPELSYEDHFAGDIPKDVFLNVMVGDLQRLKEFPKLGYQIEQDIPDEVWQAFRELVRQGYTEHLIPGAPV